LLVCRNVAKRGQGFASVCLGESGYAVVERHTVNGSLLVAGASSDAGKSVVTAGLCRWLHRQGVSVAPFKAMNMSNNSVVTSEGGEIGRAQGAQAAACGLKPETAMNPVLLKPGSDRRSQVILRGRPYTEVSASTYRELHPVLKQAVLEAYDELAARFDVVLCEGAGSPAEINLRATDLANLGLAQARDLPVIVVGDVDRGGVFASLFGTLALLSVRDQSLISGFVINKFRGDERLLVPGVERLTQLTGRPTLGVLPWAPGLAF
jgi:adenosylcobyric acid synthase